MIEFLRRNRVLIASGFFLALAVSLILQTGGGPERSDRLGRLLLELISPLQRPVAILTRGAGRTESAMRDVFRTRRKLTEARARLRHLEEQVGHVDEVTMENERLRGLLAFRSTLKGDVVGARVIARDPSSLAQTLVIDRGEADGIRKGAAVLVPLGIVGHVFLTSPHAARVLLITDHNSGVDAIVQRTRARGIVEGAIDGGCGLKFVKRTEDIKVGDVVVTSGMDGIFPKGRPIGQVTAVDKRGHGLFQYADLATSVDMADLEEVLVTRGPVEVDTPPSRPEP